MMRSLAITNKGFEDICALEIKELIDIDSTLKDSCVEFDATEKELIKLSYLSQSINRILILFDDFDFKDIDDLIKKTQQVKYDAKIFNKKSFVVRCIKENNDINSTEIEQKVGEVFFSNLKSKVDLKNSDLSILVFIEGNHAHIGVDFAGVDLSKRSYKIYLAPKSLRGTLAYELLRYAGYDKNKKMLDCFAANGNIVIEAALFGTKYSVRNFDKDKFRFAVKINEDYLEELDELFVKEKLKIYAFDHLLPNIEKIKKNAKIANILKFINVSKVDIEWLDTKVDEKTIDIICSYFPEVSKRTEKHIVKKTYKEFFYQADFILKKKGIIVALLHNPEELIASAKEAKFKFIEKREIYSGQEKLVVLKFSR